MRQPSRDERQAVLDRKRTLKMARSAHAYVRGNTAKFRASALSEEDRGKLARALTALKNNRRQDFDDDD